MDNYIIIIMLLVLSFIYIIYRNNRKQTKADKEVEYFRENYNTSRKDLSISNAANDALRKTNVSLVSTKKEVEEKNRSLKAEIVNITEDAKYYKEEVTKVFTFLRPGGFIKAIKDGEIFFKTEDGLDKVEHAMIRITIYDSKVEMYILEKIGKKYTKKQVKLVKKW